MFFTCRNNENITCQSPANLYLIRQYPSPHIPHIDYSFYRIRVYRLGFVSDGLISVFLICVHLPALESSLSYPLRFSSLKISQLLIG